MLAVAACAQNGGKTDAASTDTGAQATATTASEAPAATQTETAPAQEEKPASYYQDKVAVVHTTEGDIHIRFFPDVAPNHVKNFIDLAEKGFYDNTKFHRVIPGFMIQGGDPNTIAGDPATWGTGGTQNYLQAEFNPVKHTRGIVSMARAMDPNSASSQFFIMVADAPSLDNQYSVFGRVTKGMEVADRIVSAPRDESNNRPVKPVAITGIELRPASENEKGPALK